MANWYVDSTNTSGTYDGTSTNNAWRTIERPLSASDGWTSYTDSGGGSALSAGDTVYLRGSHAESWDTNPSAYIEIDCVGTSSSPIVFIGDTDGSVWGDGGGTPTIYTDESSDAYFRESGNDNHLVFIDIAFERQTGLTGSPDYIFEYWGYNGHFVFIRCTFSKYKGGFRAAGSSYWEFIDCTFDSTGYTNASAGVFMRCDQGRMDWRNGDITGASGSGSGYSDLAFMTITNRWNQFYVEDAVISGFDDVFWGTGGRDVNFLGRNVDISTDVTYEIINQSQLGPGSGIIIQDINDNPRLAKQYLPNGTITTVENAGGRDVVAKINPNDNCNAYYPIKCFEFWIPATAGISKDYSIDAYATGWATRPDETEFVFEVGYYDTASSSSMTWTASTDTIDADDTWYTLTVSSISPAEDGVVILRGWLKLDEGDVDEEVWVDISGNFNTYWFAGFPYRTTGAAPNLIFVDDGGM